MSTLAPGDPNELAKAAATGFARRLIARSQEILGPDLLGAYLIGSLAHAGFSRRYSDVDIALVTEAGLSQQALERLRSEAVALSGEWGPKVSVFWADRGFSAGRFPPLDRIDYLDHGIAVVERERVQPPRPTLDGLRDYLRGAPFAGWSDQARTFAAAERLDPKDRKPYLRTLLYPARFCYSWLTGRMGSNDVAVSFLSEHHVPGLDLPGLDLQGLDLQGLDVGLIGQALQCRRAAADPDALFPARSALPAQIEACAALLAASR